MSYRSESVVRRLQILTSATILLPPNTNVCAVLLGRPLTISPF